MANKYVVGIAVGVGLKWASPFIVPALGAMLRPVLTLDMKPLAKAGLKFGWLGIERGRELAAYLGETLQDCVAEARAELVREAKSSADEA